MLAIIKKELKNYFYSPIGYVVIGIFLFIFSLFFYLTAIGYSITSLADIFYNTALYGLMFMIPLITMWAISGERKSGTEQLIMTSPVSMFSVVIAKFISAMILIIIPVICTLMYFGILSFFQMPDIPTYLTSILGFVLLSMAYVSFGILASSLTESPIIAGIITFIVVFLSIYGSSFFAVPSSLSVLNSFLNFIDGQIDITGTVLFITFTILCLIITMIIMQRRKSVK